jgi:hypothetical protein
LNRDGKKRHGAAASAKGALGSIDFSTFEMFFD